MLRFLIGLAMTGLALFPAITGAVAQPRPENFENPTNLQVLPEDISPEELRAIMTSIPRQVGIRCSSCHEGPDGAPISEYDFASDAKERKRVAREMMRMVRGINAIIGGIDRGPDHSPVEVKCVTCHRGVPQPRMIEDILAGTIASDGIGAAEAEYREMHDIWGDGRFAYDFSAFKLGEIANELADEGDLDGAMRFHRLNMELNPDDAFSFLMRGNLYEQLERLPEAIADLEIALQKEPSFANFLEPRIDGLKARLGED